MWVVVAAVVILSAYGVSGQGAVTLEQLSGSTTCSGSTTVIRCETNVTEVLEWRDTNGNMVRFTRSGDDPGASGSLGPVFVNITEEIGSTLVSQATVTNTSTNVLLTCRNDVFTEIVTVTLEGRSSAPQNFACSSSCTWDPPAGTPNCCNEYVVEMTNTSGTVRIPVGLATVYNTPNILSDTTIGVFCRDRIGRESARSSQLILTAPTDPSPTADSSLSTSPTPTTSTSTPMAPIPTGCSQIDSSFQWWIWLIIGLLFLLLAIYAFVMTVLYIYEKCKPKDNNNSIKHGVELDEQKL